MYPQRLQSSQVEKVKRGHGGSESVSSIFIILAVSVALSCLNLLMVAKALTGLFWASTAQCNLVIWLEQKVKLLPGLGLRALCFC